MFTWNSVQVEQYMDKHVPHAICMCSHIYSTVSSVAQDGLSALYYASREGHNEVVDTLLKRGADPNLATKV